MSQIPKILVVGCGPVGTMCSYSLQNSGRATVTAILRSAYDDVEANGFHIKSIDHGEVDGWRPHNISRTLDDALQYGPFDYVLVALKNLPDVYSIPDIIRPAVASDKATIVLVQNGIDIEQPLIDAFPDNVVISGVPLIGCEQNGREILHNDPDILLVGAYTKNPHRMGQGKLTCSEFAEIYTAGGAKCEVKENLTWFRWRKLCWNASFNAICALTNLDSGLIQDAGALETLIKPAMGEVAAIASAAGYQLPEDIKEQMVAFTPRELYLKPSMQVDAIRGRPMEIEVILGNALRIAEKVDVDAKLLGTLYQLLKAKQRVLLSAR